jgi:hypothetical protein
MEPRKNSPLNAGGVGEAVIVSADAMERLARSLVVAHGYVQLLQRRARQETPLTQDDHLQMLAKLEKATRVMKVELHALDATGTRHQRLGGDA